MSDKNAETRWVLSQRSLIGAFLLADFITNFYLHAATGNIW
jgi:hypothetical protein